jgi:predicted RNA polymerase sigma factor
VRRYGHFSAAEDAVQEALLAAAVQWPDAGVPGNPRGWLITVAARRLTDLLRAEQTRQRREETTARRMLPGEWLTRPADHSAQDLDDTLILLFLCSGLLPVLKDGDSFPPGLGFLFHRGNARIAPGLTSPPQT